MKFSFAVMVIVGAVSTVKVMGELISTESVGILQAAVAANVMDQNLLTKLLVPGSTQNIVITMTNPPSSIIASFNNKTFSTQEARNTALINELKANAKTSQEGLLNQLQILTLLKPYTAYKGYWATNQVFVQKADISLIATLLKVLKTVISKILEEAIVFVGELINLNLMDNPTVGDGPQWGVARTEAPAVWEMGFNGQGVKVVTTDTGAHGPHDALTSNFGGLYAWFDPSGKFLTPADENGHGTHTTANIAGTQKGVGMAPGAEWGCCRGCALAGGGCSQEHLTACAQFWALPTHADGSNPDGSKRPAIISNSWGGGRGNTFYNPSIELLRALGIIVLMANGNSGPSCGTANSPADNTDVIAVGSTGMTSGVSSFSSRGPSYENVIKPDLSAPGEDIISAWYSTNSKYAVASGTSMSTPHAAGAAALMLSAYPGLTQDQVLEALNAGCVPATPTNAKCGGIDDSTTIPNNNVGYGIINARKSMEWMLR